jgi:hypothetical protein
VRIHFRTVAAEQRQKLWHPIRWESMMVYRTHDPAGVGARPKR